MLTSIEYESRVLVFAPRVAGGWGPVHPGLPASAVRLGLRKDARRRRNRDRRDRGCRRWSSFLEPQQVCDVFIMVRIFNPSILELVISNKCFDSVSALLM
jgi:hypothetical protein